MAVEGATQALVAAFLFGIVLNAAAAALVLYLRGHGLAAVFRDSQRLVLVLFLLSAALWAQIDFITILLDITSPTPCQIGIIFSTIFDQFARFSIEQFLLWALNNNNGAKLSVTQLIPQVLVLARFLAGAVFIGFTRPQTDDFCLATTSSLPVGIVVAGLDGAIILFLIIRAYSTGGVAKDNHEGKGFDADRARALMSIMLGLVFWTGTSVPLLLGIETLALATRTALPAGGLLVVIIFVASGAGTLNTARATGSRPPEAPSPRRINISRDISTSDTDYPPSRFEDLKEAAIRSSTTFVNPREAPRVKDETSVEGFPPFPANEVTVTALARNLDRSASHKKGVFGFGNGKIAIGHPILQENAGQNPLSKIAVMDLQAAAIADRERRAKMQAEENMAASRPAGPLMGMTPEEVLTRGVSLKRKEVASVSIRESVFPGALHPEDVAVALTTSAQLSPAGEDARRRSPRPSLQEEPVQRRQPSPVQAAEPVQHQSGSPQNRPVTTQQPLLKSNIRPSRAAPPPPKTTSPEPSKTPLQRRPTIGLPSNPRAQGLKVAEEPGSQHRTVLFLNNIQYNDPLAVEAIIKTAGNPATKTTAPVAETVGRTASVVNRPRPIPRKTADSLAQSSPALAHRRSKSSGSLMGRKSLLASSPGSPTTLPPLPSLPRSASVAARPQPNNTKSMTFEEKVTLMFPTPPSANAIKRRSSVPDVPRIPVSYLDMDWSPNEPYDRQHSNRTTKTSFRTESVLEVDEIPRLPANMVNTTNETGSSWLRAFGDGNPSKPAAKQTSEKRGSSPIIPGVQVRASAWTETTYDRSEDDTTNWTAPNSPELAVSVPVMQRLGLPASVRMPVRQDMRGSELSFSDNRSRETLPIMLDTSTVQQTVVQELSVPEAEVVATPELPTWHRRVGDNCPTFSHRKKKSRSRMPPPAPLALHMTSTKKMLAIHVEPSPLESPGQAIQQIQSQLKKLDELEQHTPQSASRRLELLEDLEREMGQQVEHWEEIKHDMGRDSLSSMQTASPMARNSRHESVASTINMVPRESIRQSIGAERRGSRLTRMRSNDNPTLPVPVPSVRNSGSPQLSKWQKRLTEAQMDYMDAQLLRGSNLNFMLSKAQLASPTPPDSDHSSEAGGSPLPSPSEAPAEQILQARPSPNASLLWAPTSQESAAATSLLWTPVSKPIPEPEAALPGLSVRLPQRKESAPLRIETSQLWRKPYNTAHRSTSGLWRPVWASAAPPAAPLVRAPSKSGSTSQKPPRPLTQRPPRRNKRVTLLPDIIENPEPLPDKRGTLGIFQFPWGEKSDTAIVQPRPSMYMAMPGTMTSGGPSFGGRAKQESDEYSSSFFDDYDDEIALKMDSDEGEDSDDSFDETTLWEIASLLKTDAVPSRNSLLPQPSGSVVDSYMEELGSDEEDESREQSIVIGLAEPRELFPDQQRDSATIESTTLVMLEDALETETAPEPVPRVGLPANPRPSLNRSVSPAASDTAPAPKVFHLSTEVRGAETAPKQGSAGLWGPPSQADRSSPRGGLFVPGSRRLGSSEEPAAKHMTRRPRPAEHKPLEQLASTNLWAAKDSVRQGERNWILGVEQTARPSLWVHGFYRPAYRGSPEEPAARYMTRKPRPAEHKPLEQLASTNLWVVKSAVRQERNWILGAKEVDRPIQQGGLWVHGFYRPAYRGSSEEPAAKSMNRKPRPAEHKPLEQLASTKLWVAKSTVGQGERNWILGTKEAGRTSPARGLWAYGSRRPTYRGSSEEPAAKYMSRKPRPTEHKPLERLSSTKLWTSEDVVSHNERNWILGAKPQRQAGRIQRPRATPSDWKAALNKAITASSKFKRVAATPAQWKAALEEAISLSARAPAFDSAVRHPVFAATSVVTHSEWSHPAATGYTNRDDTRALEQELEKEEEDTSNGAILAQIVALEEERLFAERAAKEEYRRRTTMTAAVAEPEPVPVMDTVQDLQRHLSWQIRQSLVFSPAVAPAPVAAVSRSVSSSKRVPVSVSVPTTLPTTLSKVQSKPNNHLWTPTSHPTATTTPSSTTVPSLWLPPTTTHLPPTARHSATAEEDAAAASQRARRRRAMQKKQRRQEILAQMAAVERGLNPFVDFAGMGLWSAAAAAAAARGLDSGMVMRLPQGGDWLHSVCVRRKGVVLRY